MKNSESTAFPVVSDCDINKSYLGLTKREYFAGLAMQGILSNRELQLSMIKDIEYSVRKLHKYPEITIENCIEINAVAIADELLKQLELSQVLNK